MSTEELILMFAALKYSTNEFMSSVIINVMDTDVTLWMLFSFMAVAELANDILKGFLGGANNAAGGAAS